MSLVKIKTSKFSPVKINVFCNIAAFQVQQWEWESKPEKEGNYDNLYPPSPHMVLPLYWYNKSQNHFSLFVKFSPMVF